MGEKIIAVDIDEVLAETLRSILEKNNYMRKGNKVEWDDLINYNLWEIEKLGITKNWALWLFIKFQLGSGLLNRIKPVKGAKKKILELKSKGYKLYAVTARRNLVKLSTKLRLKRYFSDCFQSIVYANFFTSRARKKSDICREIGASIIIEDNLETCIDCASKGFKCYMFDKPWNQSDVLPDGITRVYSWDEIML